MWSNVTSWGNQVKKIQSCLNDSAHFPVQLELFEYKLFKGEYIGNVANLRMGRKKQMEGIICSPVYM